MSVRYRVGWENEELTTYDNLDDVAAHIMGTGWIPADYHGPLPPATYEDCVAYVDAINCEGNYFGVVLTKLEAL